MSWRCRARGSISSSKWAPSDILKLFDEGGYAESGKVVARLIETAQRLGVELRSGQRFARLHEKGSRYYGFPANRDGVVKIANHGIGRAMHPESPQRVVTPEETAHFREFLRATFPRLAEAPIVYTRVRLYCDTWDEHLWIARDPQREGLVVAAGGSGHAFKFAPALGDIIADALEEAPNPLLRKFRWRPEVRPARGEEAARHHAEASPEPRRRGAAG